jgi:trimeric autotransporter adhesin
MLMGFSSFMTAAFSAEATPAGSSTPQWIAQKTAQSPSDRRNTTALSHSKTTSLAIAPTLPERITAAARSHLQSTRAAAPPKIAPPAIAAAESIPLSPLTLPARVGGSFSTGSGQPEDSSWIELLGFFPLTQQPGRSLTFLTGQVGLTTTGETFSGNLMLGQRWYGLNRSQQSHFFGVYLAYDAQTHAGNAFHQIGTGLEAGNDTWEFRSNLYLPLGDRTRQLDEQRTIRGSGTLTSPQFQGNFLVASRGQQTIIQREFESARWGFDLEVGTRILRLSDRSDLRLFGGVYYSDPAGGESDDSMSRDLQAVWGWRTRLELRLSDTLRSGLSLSQDDRAGTRLAWNLQWFFPSLNANPRPPASPEASPSVASQPHPMMAQTLAEPPRRQNQILTDRYHTTTVIGADPTPVPLTNPATGQAWRFQHVVAGATGDGTVEAPTGSVAAAIARTQAQDLVLVDAGNGTALTGFTIPNEVQVLSTALPREISTLEFGTVTLSGTGTGILPTVEGSVQLGDRTRLSGFVLRNSLEASIQGNQVSNITLDQNRIENSNAEGISLQNVTGSVVIAKNTIQNAQREGILIESDRGGVQLTLDQNIILNNGLDALGYDGVALKIGGASSDRNQITVTNNQISGHSFSGLALNLVDRSNSQVVIEQNQFRQNQFNGLEISVANQSAASLRLNQNTTNENGAAGLVVNSRGTSSGQIEITNHLAQGNGEDGILISTSSQGAWVANLTNNRVEQNQGYGAFVQASGSQSLQVTLQGNLAIGNAISGLAIEADGQSQVRSVWRSNQAENNGDFDGEVSSEANANLCLQARDNRLGSLRLADQNSGSLQVEADSLPNNTIGQIDDFDWQGQTVPQCPN